MVTKAIRPAIFKWRHTEPELILCAVRWYLRYSLSFRDVEELLEGWQHIRGSLEPVRHRLDDRPGNGNR